MRLPKRGERGFTLIELLIVVAILGVLAAVVIPNVTRFFGKGEEEAARTELHNIQTAVTAMMVDNKLTSIPAPVNFAGLLASNDMAGFPDATSSDSVPSPAGKVYDPEGYAYDFATSDNAGYLLFGHDIYALPNPNSGLPNVNYLNMQQTTYFYTCELDGTVRQWIATDATIPTNEIVY